MTYIEFFDNNVAENICASLAKPPQRVVLVGDKPRQLQKHAQRYRRVFLARGFEVEFVCHCVERTGMAAVLQGLRVLLERYDDCVFDLTGGDSMYLVAVGMLAGQYPKGYVQMHRFNLRTGTVMDCDMDGTTIALREAPELTVEENIRIYGGDIIYDSIKPGTTYLWDMDREFEQDIWQMWEVCRKDVRLWNQQISVLETAQSLCPEDREALTIFVSVPLLQEELYYKNRSYVLARGLLGQLCERGLLTGYTADEDYITVSFKNLQVKRCLTKAGNVLEMVIYLAGLDACGEDEEVVYQDALNGVHIDWDGHVHDGWGMYDTCNEIDVLLMHGIVPVFVSCKNGNALIEELYKLNTVAQRFGGRYARKVLVATALDEPGNYDEFLRQRAENMGIRVVEGIQSLTREQLARLVGSFWGTQA